MSIADDLNKLEALRRSGALTDAEFADAKAALLRESATSPQPPTGQVLAEHLADTRYQNELARIDREWEIERQQYLIPDRYGRRQVPTPGMGIVTAVIGGGFGALWTIFALSITGGAPDVGPFAVAKVIFPLFGVVFTLAAVGFGIYCYARAQKYQQAYDAYRARRDGVRPGDFHGG